MKQDEKKRAIAQARRKQLSDLSNKLKTANLLILRDVSITINDLLVKYYEKQAGRPLELNTYEQWKEHGYQVKKGSISFMVWGKPLKSQRKTEEQQTGTDNTEEGKNDDFFPVCHLFDISQCYEIKAETK